MTIFQILANIFAPKKKKIVKPVVYTPPTPTGPSTNIDPNTGEVITTPSANISEFDKQINLIKSKYSYLKYLDIGKNSIVYPSYLSSQNGVKDFIAAVSPLYNLLKDESFDDVLKTLSPVYSVGSYLKEVWGPGDNGIDVPGGIFFNWKFFKGGPYFGAAAPFKEKCSVGFFKNWKATIESEFKLPYDVVQKYFLLFYPLIKNGTYTTENQLYDEANKIEKLISDGRTNYQDSLNAAIYEIKICAKKAKDLYELQPATPLDSYFEKVRMRTEFYKLKDLINLNYNNALGNIAFNWTEPIRPMANDNRQEPAPGTTTGGGSTTGGTGYVPGGGQLQGGVDTSLPPTSTSGSSIADLNTRPNQIGTLYPQWTNKPYLTSEYVIYNGLTYKNSAPIPGSTNNTPDIDYRWVRV